MLDQKDGGLGQSLQLCFRRWSPGDRGGEPHGPGARLGSRGRPTTGSSCPMAGPEPAGDQVVLTDLPLNIIPLADNRHALVATSGYNAHELSLIDLEDRRRSSIADGAQSWYGLALDARRQTGLVVGGRRQRAARVPARGTRSDPRQHSGAANPSRRQETEGESGRRPSHFRSGLALDPRRQDALLARRRRRHRSRRLDLDDPEGARRSAPAGIAALRRRRWPATGAQLYVSDWAGRIVLVLDPVDLRHRRQDRRRRASQPDRRPSRGRPDLRRLRIEQQRVGDRHPARDRHRDDRHGAVPAGPRREHARRPGRRSRRQDALRGQRRQQLRRGHRHRSTRPEPGQGLHPHRLVSDRRGRHARRQAAAGRRRQGEPDQAQPDRPRPRPSERRPSRASPTAERGCRSRTSAPRSRDRSRSCRSPTTRRSPPTPRPSTRIAPTPTSC